MWSRRRLLLSHRAALTGFWHILALPCIGEEAEVFALQHRGRGLTSGPEDAQNPRDARHGYRVVAVDVLPGRLVLGLRALFALLFGLTALFMILLAALFPRASTILIVQFYAGFVLLDGLLCLAAAARALMRPLPRSLVALEGVVEVVTA